MRGFVCLVLVLVMMPSAALATPVVLGGGTAYSLVSVFSDEIRYAPEVTAIHSTSVVKSGGLSSAFGTGTLWSAGEGSGNLKLSSVLGAYVDRPDAFVAAVDTRQWVRSQFHPYVNYGGYGMAPWPGILASSLGTGVNQTTPGAPYVAAPSDSMSGAQKAEFDPSGTGGVGSYSWVPQYMHSGSSLAIGVKEASGTTYRVYSMALSFQNGHRTLGRLARSHTSAVTWTTLTGLQLTGTTSTSSMVYCDPMAKTVENTYDAVVVKGSGYATCTVEAANALIAELEDMDVEEAFWASVKIARETPSELPTITPTPEVGGDFDPEADPSEWLTEVESMLDGLDALFPWVAFLRELG